MIINMFEWCMVTEHARGSSYHHGAWRPLSSSLWDKFMTETHFLIIL